jgi:NAD(P)H-hydrate epimerase
MRLLTAAEHGQLDRATMQKDGLSEIDLMERAATAWSDRFVELFPSTELEVAVVCGPGNNGGDGLVVARKLRLAGYPAFAIVVQPAPARAPLAHNLKRAHSVGVPIRYIGDADETPTLAGPDLIIDAIFGTGLNRPPGGLPARLIGAINASPAEVVSLDLPSGLHVDSPTNGTVVKADRTLSLGYPKRALFAPANTSYLGRWELVPFTVDEEFVDGLPPGDEMLTATAMAGLRQSRAANDHKGTFGHALIVAGSFGKMGAAVICARAALRAGAGQVTTHIPRSGYEIMQISFPEAMCSIDPHRYRFTEISAELTYEAIGVGPGLGTDPATLKGLTDLLEHRTSPIVLDADALNLIAEHPELWKIVPPSSILTPHPKEFERLFGPSPDDFSRWELQRERAASLGLVILLKTGYTTIATPDGRLFFNTTGNPGMATGGTGDALTGIVTGLLAQGYGATNAARLSVFLHGLAGDLAAEVHGQESLLAEDVVQNIGRAFRALIRHPNKRR